MSQPPALVQCPRQPLSNALASLSLNPMCPVLQIVDVEAVVTAVSEPIESATQRDVELAVTKIFTISRAAPDLPFMVSGEELCWDFLVI